MDENIKYTIKQIKSKQAKEYIRNNHYSRGSHNGPSPCFGLYNGEELIGVLMFATPCSEAVRASIYGSDRKDEVTELHRLHIKDGTPKNTESWFISRCLKKLKTIKPHITAVVSFADSTEGHYGVIYQATNAYYYGRTANARFYIDSDGRLRHPRQSGVNITISEAKNRGWTPVKRMGKFRYLFLLPNNKGHKRRLIKECKIMFEEYPKRLDCVR